MKDATVTLSYESFQEIKRKADLYDATKVSNLAREERQIKFIESLCHTIEKANDSKSLEHKQFYIARGIREICENYGMDLLENYGELDEGQDPEAEKPVIST
ncbi:hypothetical protein FRY98_24730 [Paenibacillus faecis]|uniref:Uncharacterized protein n=1 Tax=Paenibacillus faecis TaxID=862114 RepID=A0A5D0CP46_9BACL|nr:hypothetical protein [Paenibacillus faecis]TYA10975.1 hypothetical protein FRY98_24730 [Paenibacillus faecis]